MKKRTNKTLLMLVLVFALLVVTSACGETSTTEATTSVNSETSIASTSVDTESSGTTDEIFIALVAKGYNGPYWQCVAEGAQDAADDYGITITFDGPTTETEIQAQVQMLNTALSKNPDAICLAALSTESVMDQLNQALTQNIPVIGFDSGVPDAPEGSIYATAATDNYASGAIGAEAVYELVKDKLASGAVEEPVVIGVVSKDAISESITNRTLGFTEKMVELIIAGGIDEVAVVGHDTFASGDESTAKVLIDVSVGLSAAAVDMATAANSILNKDNVIAIFGTNGDAAFGILDATNEGADLVTNGIIAVGFDAGLRQKEAVAAGIFACSITQDPYNIGYQAVELAYKAIMGEEITDVDTGCKVYTADNMNDEDIAMLLYD